jgi:hypothetical protein
VTRSFRNWRLLGLSVMKCLLLLLLLLPLLLLLLLLLLLREQKIVRITLL